MSFFKTKSNNNETAVSNINSQEIDEIESQIGLIQTDVNTANSNISTLQTDVNNAEMDIINLIANRMTRVYNTFGEELKLEGLNSAKIYQDLSFRSTNFQRLYKDYIDGPRLFINTDIENENETYLNSIKTRSGNSILSIGDNAGTAPLLNINFLSSSVIQMMLGNTAFLTMNNATNRIIFNKEITTDSISPTTIGSDIDINGNVNITGSCRYKLKSVEITQVDGPYNVSGYEYHLDDYKDYDVIIFRSNAAGGTFKMNLPNPSETQYAHWRGREVLFKQVYHYNNTTSQGAVNLLLDSNTGLDNVAPPNTVVLDRDREWRRLYFSDLGSPLGNMIYMTGLRNY